MSVRRIVLTVATITTLLPVERLVAQTPAPARATAPGFFANRVSGDLTLFAEFYGVSGLAARRPGTTLRLLASPRVRLFGNTAVGLDITASNEGSQVRQNLSQFGLEPSWSWGRLHMGDFSRDLTSFTVQGIRVRGGGVDLTPGLLRFSVQAGTTQQALAATTVGPTYRRSLVAGAVGYGKEERTFAELLVVRARDQLIPDDLPLIDTLGVDTLDVDQRPQQLNRPQENLVGGVRGAARLFSDRLALKGELTAALLTRDRAATGVNPDSIDLVPGGVAEPNLSSSRDVAWRGELAWRGRAFNLRAGWEEVGAGFTSLGVGFLVNDRRALGAGGDVRLLKGSVVLSGRWQGQRDNLSGQRRFTTDRQTLNGTAIVRLGAGALSLAGLVNTAGNDATNDSLRVDNRTLSAQAAWQQPFRLAGQGGAMAFSYALQQTEDRSLLRAIPRITVHSLSLTPTIPLGSVLSLAPTVSAVLTVGGDAATEQHNVLGGLRANAKLGGGATGSAQFTQSFTAARPVTLATLQGGVRLPYDFQFSVQGRWNRYGAIGTRPAFTERFATTSLSRSF